MRATTRLLLLALAAAPLAVPVSAEEAPVPRKQTWSFDGVFGSYDLASAQRGFQIYAEVCSNCHSMRQLHYRDLTGLGLNEAEVKAIASNFTVPQGLDDQGSAKEGPATPASQFRSPFANEKIARAVNNGALPPDLSLIVNAREYGRRLHPWHPDRLCRPAGRLPDAGWDVLQPNVSGPSDRDAASRSTTAR